MEFTRLTKKYVVVDVTALLADGGPATVTGYDAALTSRAATTNKATLWVPTTWDAEAQEATVLVAGPDAEAGALLVLGDNGGRLWLRNVDEPETDLFSACVIRVT